MRPGNSVEFAKTVSLVILTPRSKEIALVALTGLVKLREVKVPFTMVVNAGRIIPEMVMFQVFCITAGL